MLRLILAVLLSASLALPNRISGGGTDCLRAATATNLNNQSTLTVCSWANATSSTGGYNTIYWKGDTSLLMTFRMGPTRHLEFYISNTLPMYSTSADNIIPAYGTTWVYVCGSYTGSDGGPRTWLGSPGGTVTETSYVARVEGGGTHIDDNDGAYIGCRAGGGEAMNGVLAEVRVWNVVLTAAEMTSAQYGYPVRPSNQLAYWPLQGRTSPEPDRGPSGYNLTVTGTTTDTSLAPVSPAFGWWNVAKFFRLQAPWLG